MDAVCCSDMDLDKETAIAVSACGERHSATSSAAMSRRALNNAAVHNINNRPRLLRQPASFAHRLLA